MEQVERQGKTKQRVCQPQLGRRQHPLQWWAGGWTGNMRVGNILGGNILGKVGNVFCKAGNILTCTNMLLLFTTVAVTGVQGRQGERIWFSFTFKLWQAKS